MIINIGGQGATLATAYGLDPTIADKCIVYYTDIRVYNGHYEWASRIIAANFRVVSWGDDNWWIVKRCQNEWNVLQRPDHCRASENDPMSGEWRLLTEMHKPMLDHMVHQFRMRGEYSNDGRSATPMPTVHSSTHGCRGSSPTPSCARCAGPRCCT